MERHQTTAEERVERVRREVVGPSTRNGYGGENREGAAAHHSARPQDHQEVSGRKTKVSTRYVQEEPGGTR